MENRDRRAFVCRLIPTFVEAQTDVIAKLNGYEHREFVVSLFHLDEHTAVGEVSFGRAGERVSALLEDLASKRDQTSPQAAGLDQLRNKVAGDIRRVLEYEGEIVGGPFSLSCSDGVFEFSRTILCEDSAQEIVEHLIESYAFAFLQTLGTMTSCTRT